MATYWITKFALSGGIAKIDNLEKTTWRDGSETIRRPGDYYTSYRIGRDAFDNEADAKADAEKRRQKKIESLRKQIAKLEKLTF